MFDLLVIYRAMNLYIHHAHNLTKGDEFFQDHEFFGELYAKADGFYDDIIERMIGLGDENIPLLDISMAVNKLLMSKSSDFLGQSLFFIQEAIKKIEDLGKNDKLSIGTQNLLAGQADVLEVYIYKIKRRMK